MGAEPSVAGNPKRRELSPGPTPEFQEHFCPGRRKTVPQKERLLASRVALHRTLPIVCKPQIKRAKLINAPAAHNTSKIPVNEGNALRINPGCRIGMLPPIESD